MCKFRDGYPKSCSNMAQQNQNLTCRAHDFQSQHIELSELSCKRYNFCHKKRNKQHPTFTGLSRSGRAFHALGGPSHGHSRSFMLIHAHIFSPEIQNVVFEFLGNQASTATVMMLSVRLWRNNRWPYFPPIYYPLTSNSPVLLRIMLILSCLQRTCICSSQPRLRSYIQTHALVFKGMMSAGSRGYFWSISYLCHRCESWPAHVSLIVL